MVAGRKSQQSGGADTSDLEGTNGLNHAAGSLTFEGLFLFCGWRQDIVSACRSFLYNFALGSQMYSGWRHDIVGACNPFW